MSPNDTPRHQRPLTLEEMIEKRDDPRPSPLAPNAVHWEQVIQLHRLTGVLADLLEMVKRHEPGGTK